MIEKIKKYKITTIQEFQGLLFWFIICTLLLMCVTVIIIKLV